MQPWKHFRTITKHRHQVIKHCFHAGILWQGLRHDLSKYTPTEFIPGAKYYEGEEWLLKGVAPPPGQEPPSFRVLAGLQSADTTERACKNAAPICKRDVL